MVGTLLLCSGMFLGCATKEKSADDNLANGEEIENSWLEQDQDTEESIWEQTNRLALECIDDKERGNLHYVALLQQLQTVDADMAERIDRIFAFWDHSNQENYVQDVSTVKVMEDSENCCIVVLGFQLEADGTMKEELVGRLQTALECANALPSAKVLVTGGGTAMNNPLATEAGCMAAWLLDHGIEEDRIIIENNSRTTVENALFSCDILQEDYPEVKELIMVSSDYHVSLGAILFAADAILDGKSDLSVVGSVGYDAGRNSRYSRQTEGEQLKELYNRKQGRR
ncbi:MAG: YdcF family protein [Lachnospiraceae bacterium]|nr:YdcF family protein [Lachnospiraceae bacterium]